MDVNLITAVSAAAGAVLSGVATTIAIIVAYKVHQNQKLLGRFKYEVQHGLTRRETPRGVS